MTVGGVIVVILAVGICVNHGPSTVETSLDLGEAPAKDQLKRGATRNRTSTTLHCEQGPSRGRTTHRERRHIRFTSKTRALSNSYFKS